MLRLNSIYALLSVVILVASLGVWQWYQTWDSEKSAQVLIKLINERVPLGSSSEKLEKFFHDQNFTFRYKGVDEWDSYVTDEVREVLKGKNFKGYYKAHSKQLGLRGFIIQYSVHVGVVAHVDRDGKITSVETFPIWLP